MPFLKTIYLTALISLSLWALPLTVFALQPDQVRGKVLAVDPEFRFLTIQIEKSGDDVAASVGSVHTYFVPESITPEYETTVDSITYRTNDDIALKRLQAGDEVTLDFRAVDRRFEFERLENKEPKDPDVRAAARSHEIVIVEAGRAEQPAADTDE